MPVRDKLAGKSGQLNIEAAFDVDSDVAEYDQTRAYEVGAVAAKPEAPGERKTAIIQVAVYPSWRKHFHIEAAKRGEKLAPIALRALIERYGLPEE